MLAWPSRIPCVKLNPSAAMLVPVNWLAYVERATATPAVVVAVEGGIGSDDAASSAAWPAGAGAECACIFKGRLRSCLRLFVQQESALQGKTLAEFNLGNFLCADRWRRCPARPKTNLEE